MPDFKAFFLNSSSAIVQLETIEINHPYFSKQYRIVRNAIAGLTATLEDSSVGNFDYYPVKITPSSSFNDLDQTLQVVFGDLGAVLPAELDRLIADAQSIPQRKVYPGALLGAWVDNVGQMILPPFLVGLGGKYYVPVGATHLQLGINDDFMFDNSGTFAVSINGVPIVGGVGSQTALYVVSGGHNTAYPYAPSSSSPPVSVAVTPGDLLFITVTGQIHINGTGPLLFADGDSTLPTGVPGIYVQVPQLPKTVIKPSMIYRSFRSDDLSAPLNGPYVFDLDALSFDKQGVTLQCNAKRRNLTATGELYEMDRFPMLRGFL